MQEQIKEKNNVFNRFSYGQLRVADVLSPPFLLFGCLSQIFVAMKCTCVLVCVIVAVNREQWEDDGK